LEQTYRIGVLFIISSAFLNCADSLNKSSHIKKANAVLLCLAFLISSHSYADDARTSPLNISFQFDTGIGSGQLSWNIAEIGGTPNVLSELNYHIKHLWMNQIKTRITLNQSKLKGLFVDLSGQRGVIQSGQSTDRDWKQNDRQALFSLSESDTTGDNTQQGTFSLGMSFKPISQIRLSPMAGFSYREQNIRVQNGVQIIATHPQDLGAFTTPLNSTYYSQWKGPHIGMELAFLPQSTSGQQFVFNANYHWITYQATADWNLRPDFQHPVSFKQTINRGHGISVSSNWIYPITQHFSANLGLFYQHFTGSNGVDQLYYANGTYQASHLNSAHWEFTQLMAGVIYQF
jgi:hypothetical protein